MASQGQAQGDPQATAVSVSAPDRQASTEPASTHRYHYSQGRRVLAQEGILDASDLKTHTRQANYQTGSHRWLADDTTQAPAQYNANGQPGKVGHREYVWDALGRLMEVRQEDTGSPSTPVARYSYNHRGERIGKTTSQAAQGQHTSYLYEDGQVAAELNEQGQITRQYLYLVGQIIAVIDTPQGQPLSKEELSAHVLLGLDTQNILKHLWRSFAGSDGQEQTTWLHTNHLGAPEAATDPSGQLIWQASYAPFGAARIIKASAGKSNDSKQFSLNLRLPGQYFDAETGLFYNKQRYYDPARGEYLTPDPLGTPDGPNGYSYVRYNPLKYVDPEGLILFAFDGTGNDRGLSNTNVWLLSQLYDENDLEVDSGRPYYIQGPGTGDASFGTSWLDGGIGFSMTDRINQQLRNLDDYVKTKTPLEKSRRQISRQDPLVVTLDIVGFSRGSAEARDFVNQVISRRDANYYRDKTKGFSGDCVSLNIRFMGLFDTVLAAGGVGRRDFNMAIPASVQYVAQAVAANEHRSKFQLESIQSSFPGNTGSETTARGWRVERGFVGAHADIGGGYNGTQGGDGGDLSDVALNWMYDRFNELGIKMKDMSASYRTVSNPILHDERNSYPFSAPIGGAPLFGEQDRNVHYPMAGGQSVPEKTAQIRGLTNAQTTPFITKNGSASSAVGTVDMAKYNDWLRRNYGVNMQ